MQNLGTTPVPPAGWSKYTIRKKSASVAGYLEMPKAVEVNVSSEPLTFASESKLAGSAGIDSSTDLVSTATTPVGIPPSLRREAIQQWHLQNDCDYIHGAKKFIIGSVSSGLTWLCLPPHSVPKAAWSPWRSHGRRSHSARNPLELYIQRGSVTGVTESATKKRQGNRRENWVHSFHGASKSLVLFLLQSEVVYFFPPESVILAATMMDGFIKRLTQLFFCLYTPTNMPSLWGYHSIKPRHSSLPETSTGFQHGPPLQSLCCPKL